MSMRAFLFVGLGLAVGAASVAAWQAWREHPPAVLPRPSARAEPTSAPRSDFSAALATVRNVDLEARVAALEGASSAKSSERSPEVERSEPTTQDIEDSFNADVRRHAAEPIDRGWASSTAAQLHAAYGEKLPGTSAEVVDVDCRSSSCRVRFEWPSRDAATNEWKRAMLFPTAVPCGRRIIVPESSRGKAGPVEVTMLLDCSDWVAAGSPPVGG
jgi:hypothetical protein